MSGDQRAIDCGFDSEQRVGSVADVACLSRTRIERALFLYLFDDCFVRQAALRVHSHVFNISLSSTSQVTTGHCFQQEHVFVSKYVRGHVLTGPELSARSRIRVVIHTFPTILPFEQVNPEASIRVT